MSCGGCEAQTSETKISLFKHNKIFKKFEVACPRASQQTHGSASSQILYTPIVDMYTKTLRTVAKSQLHFVY